MAARWLVSVVDDDESIRESLPDLLREFGFEAGAFASAEDFLGSGVLDRTHCLLLDVAMPGMSGPALQQELTRRGRTIPIVFITAHADEGVRARLLQAGAVDCLYKPFTESALLDAVTAALER
jgi:FixJ family two-component response regulator